MGLLRSLILGVVSQPMAEAMEADSRLWMMRCKCGNEISIWDIGGLRYKAAGRPRRLWRCGHCRRFTWHTVYKRSPPQQQPQDDSAPAR